MEAVNAVQYRELVVDQNRLNKFEWLASRSVCPAFNTSPGLVPTWHWLYTHETPIGVDLGEDGHPKALPSGVPADFTQRLWVSSDITLYGQTSIGQRMTLITSTYPAVLKEGRTGVLAFVSLKMELLYAETLVLSEYRTGVYRRPVLESRTGAQSVTEPMPDPAKDGPVIRTLILDEVALFQYSALLGVSHRIHFDGEYTKKVEGYPSLVVHGPLIAQLLVQHALSVNPLCEATCINVRALGLNFVGTRITLHATNVTDEGEIVAWAENLEGHKTMRIRVLTVPVATLLNA
ncbi:hypothetical protein [Burkholderia stagnalis]|uniref:hypothetical protein n=1 Tax=Burkholderia stagnalis TaxID=1503054 RepID=UPI000F5D9522|nr:hypothetical protein [Burkholderia stagnalis]